MGNKHRTADNREVWQSGARGGMSQMSEASQGAPTVGRALTAAHVGDDYLAALDLFWRHGGNAQRGFTTEFFRKADGLVAGVVMSNLPEKWLKSNLVGGKAAEQQAAMLKLCHSAGYGQRSTGDLGALQVYASPVLPADGLNMAPLQAVGAYGFAPSAFGGAAADTGMSLPATQQSEEMHAPPAGPTQRKLTKDRDARLLEALTMEEVRVHQEQIHHGLRGEQANCNSLSSKLVMQITSAEGPLKKLMCDPAFKPANRYSDDSRLEINELDPSIPVVDGDLHKWLSELKTKVTRAYQQYTQQTGQAASDPSDATVGYNPVLLYAIRLMCDCPWILASLNGAMPADMQSEASPNPNPKTQPQPQP